MTAPTLLRPPAVPAGGASSEWLSKELKRTEEAQERLNRRRGRQSQGVAGQVNQTREVAAAAIPLRAPSMVREMADLELATEYAAFLRRRPQGVEIGAGVADDDVAAAEDLASVLLRHGPDPSDGSPYARLVAEGYRPLHSRTRAGLLLGLRRSLRGGGGGGAGGGSPSQEACRSLSEQMRAVADGRSASSGGGGEGCGGPSPPSARAAGLLVRLQLAHDALMAHLQAGRGGRTAAPPPSLDVVDELFLPLARRAEYHFLKGGGGGGNGAKPEDLDELADNRRLDSLPRWMFQYLREALVGGGGGSGDSSHPLEGIAGLVRSGLLPLVRTEARRSALRASAAAAKQTEVGVVPPPRGHPYLVAAMEGGGSADPILEGYLLSRVAVLALRILVRERYVLRMSSRQPAGAASASLLGGIEECLRFDSFARDVMGVASRGTPWEGVTASLFAEYPPLLHLWIEADRSSGLETMKMAPAIRPPSRGGATASPPSPLAESYASLVGSMLLKSSVALGASPAMRRRYVAETVIPVTSFLLDGMHGAASDLRELMLDVENVRTNLCCWLDVLGGMDLAAAVLRTPVLLAPVAPRDQDLDRLCQSLVHLRDAMVDEYSSTLVDTIIMERMGLVSYFMTAPHRLMGDSGKVLTGPAAGNAAPSAEMETVLELLNAVVNVVSEAQPSDADAAEAIVMNIGRRLEEKFAEITSDPHGAIPEITRGGAVQFLADVEAVCGVLDNIGSSFAGSLISEAVFGNVLAAARLMVADNSQIRSLRDGLSGLAVTAAPMSPGVPLGHIPYAPFEVDGTLHETAVSMLDSKGFGMLDLEDAVSLLNRRKVAASSAMEALGRL